MTMKTENALKYLSRLMCLVLMVSLIACGDDDDDDNDDNDDNDDTMVDELVNTYEFTSATFTDDRVVVLQPDLTDPATVVPAPFAAGDDGTSLLRSSIEGAAECAEGVTVGIDLREDNTSWYVCDGDGTEVQQGSWSVNRTADPAVFTLTIATLSPPVDVIMEGFTLANGRLSGTAIIPLPYDATIDVTATPPAQVTGTGDPLTAESIALLTAGGVTGVAEGDANIQLVPLEIVFTVVDF